ncbi:MAG: N-acyl-D-amino-acid deacylase family protein, partial [Gemmataceae bacterium]
MVALVALITLSQAVEADVVLRGATLIDGTGSPGVVGDLAIKGDRIVAVGTFTAAKGAKEIDAKGLIAAPGFIDLHTHSDDAMVREATRANLNYLLQGVTTIVTGNCGSGPVDVGAYFKKMEAGGVGSNVLHLVPHNSVRRLVMGNVNRAPKDDELKKMQGLVEKGMQEGACGMSTGLIYDPGSYSKTPELVALASVVGRFNGLYASHIRDEGVGVIAATQEAITIGREGKLAVHISHMKSSGRKAWGLAADQIAAILQARKKGQAVTADQYPYTASSTSLTATLVPNRYREGTRKEYQARLDDAETGPRIRAALEETLKARRGGEAIRVAGYRTKPAWQGKSIDEIAKAEKKEPV